jgi:hypothetical protein
VSTKEVFQMNEPDGYLITVSGVDKYDAFRQAKTETAHRRQTDTSGKEMTKIAPLTLCYVFPQEMVAQLHYNSL